jgi:hypothetical protein
MIKKKPTKRANATVMWIKILGMVTLTTAGIVYLSALPESQQEPMVVEVVLDDHCGLSDAAFLLTATDGATSTFYNGVATLTTHPDSRIWIVSSPKYKSFGYEGPNYRAKPYMKISTRCAASSMSGIKR